MEGTCLPVCECRMRQLMSKVVEREWNCDNESQSTSIVAIRQFHIWFTTPFNAHWKFNLNFRQTEEIFSIFCTRTRSMIVFSSFGRPREGCENQSSNAVTQVLKVSDPWLRDSVDCVYWNMWMLIIRYHIDTVIWPKEDYIRNMSRLLLYFIDTQTLYRYYYQRITCVGMKIKMG